MDIGEFISPTDADGICSAYRIVFSDSRDGIFLLGRLCMDGTMGNRRMGGGSWNGNADVNGWGHSLVTRIGNSHGL